MKCENCNKEHDGSYGSGRFCSSKCARGFSTKAKRKEINQKVSKTLSNRDSALKGRKRVNRDHICEACGEKFHKYIRKGRKIRCDRCKYKAPHTKDLSDIDSILELSKRTVSKILKRLGTGCSVCS